MKDTIITVYVDTCKIRKYSNKKKDKDKVLSCVLICDNHYDAPATEEFTSNIVANSNLAWTAAVINILSNPEDFVIIDKIIPKLGEKSFIKLRSPKDGAGGTHVDGFVGDVDESEPEEYKIKFSVYSEGKRKKYSIDPKIRVIKTEIQ
ncbi:hypothetical protein [Algoriphagus namhaensis]